MKEGRDFSIIFHINNHYNDLKEDITSIDNFEAFVNSKGKRRAILFDFLQIGELTNQLSKAFLEAFDNEDSKKLIAIRNRIVHGYSTVRDDLIFLTLKNDLPRFINELNAFARNFYYEQLKRYLGKNIHVYIDRPVGSIHNGDHYPLNYGYFEKLTALDGEFQDVYVLGEDKPINECDGKVIAIIKRENDIEDKLVISLSNEYTDNEIESLISFNEQYFKHKIIK